MSTTDMVRQDLIDDVLHEIELAWRRNPDLTLYDLIAHVEDFSWPGRRYTWRDGRDKKRNNGKLLNSDLLKMFKRYNDVKGAGK